MRLLDPNGVRIAVSDERGEVLKRQGYKELEAATAAPAPTPSPGPTAPRKRRTTTQK